MFIKIGFLSPGSTRALVNTGTPVEHLFCYLSELTPYVLLSVARVAKF